MYDVVAQRIPSYGFVYPFIELALGASYIGGIQPTAVNLTTLVVMAVSSIGVIQSVFQKRKIRCACLGTVFNLPMSTVTLVEDGLHDYDGCWRIVRHGPLIVSRASIGN